MSVLRAIAVFLCGVAAGCSAQIVLPGACPNIEPMTGFDLSQYLGRWYEAEKYFFLFEFGGKCITADYQLTDNGVSVVNRQIGQISGIQSEIKGEATLVGRSDEAKLSVRFPSLPVNIAAPYWVVDTDYRGYAVVWSCYELSLFHTRNVWILTRERQPSPEVLAKAYAALDRNGISRSFLTITNQNGCTDEGSSE